ncbi:MAG: histidine phosphatase family protein [Pseudomonadota bacterium]
MTTRPATAIEGLVLLRHPRPAVAPGICYGRLDLGLDLGLGGGAADEIERALRATPRSRFVVTSPALRTRALAEALAARDGRVPAEDARLLELDFGRWEGQPWSRIDRAESDPWAADPLNLAPPGGERFRDLLARVGAALSDYPPGSVIVTHAGPIRAARMIAEGMSFDAVFAAPVPFATPIAVSAVAARLSAEIAFDDTGSGRSWRI